MRTHLDPEEVRDLYPAALILEDLAVKRAAPYGADELAGLRDANDRLRATAHDPAAAAAAEREFHHRLAGLGGDGRLHAVLGGVRRLLVPYEQAAVAQAERVHRRAEEHDEIVLALERGDRGGAARRVRAHWTSALDELTAELDA